VHVGNEHQNKSKYEATMRPSLTSSSDAPLRHAGLNDVIFVGTMRVAVFRRGAVASVPHAPVQLLHEPN
jgi:hypothetical protein